MSPNTRVRVDYEAKIVALDRMVGR